MSGIFPQYSSRVHIRFCFHFIKPNVQRVIKFYYSSVKILHYVILNYSEVLDYSTIKCNHSNSKRLILLYIYFIVYTVYHISWLWSSPWSCTIHNTISQSRASSALLKHWLTPSLTLGMNFYLIVLNKSHPTWKQIHTHLFLVTVYVCLEVNFNLVAWASRK